MVAFSGKTREQQTEGSLPTADTQKAPTSDICSGDKRTQWPETCHERTKETEMAGLRPGAGRIPDPSANGSGQVGDAADIHGYFTREMLSRTTWETSLPQHRCKDPDGGQAPTAAAVTLRSHRSPNFLPVHIKLCCCLRTSHGIRMLSGDAEKTKLGLFPALVTCGQHDGQTILTDTGRSVTETRVARKTAGSGRG